MARRSESRKARLRALSSHTASLALVVPDNTRFGFSHDHAPLAESTTSAADCDATLTRAALAALHNSYLGDALPRDANRLMRRGYRVRDNRKSACG